jgi:hypothetical protein
MREKGTRGGNDSALANRAHERERESERAKKLAPIGWPQRAESERERARGRELPLTGGVRLSGAASARPGWADLGRLGCFPFSFSLDFLIPFLFLFL